MPRPRPKGVRGRGAGLTGAGLGRDLHPPVAGLFADRLRLRLRPRLVELLTLPRLATLDALEATAAGSVRLRVAGDWELEMAALKVVGQEVLHRHVPVDLRVVEERLGLAAVHQRRMEVRVGDVELALVKLDDLSWVGRQSVTTPRFFRRSPQLEGVREVASNMDYSSLSSTHLLRLEQVGLQPEQRSRPLPDAVEQRLPLERHRGRPPPKGRALHGSVRQGRYCR
eukprot:SAG22_NODE_1842_length_3456_cov_3.666369_4_plen_226_part_00